MKPSLKTLTLTVALALSTSVHAEVRSKVRPVTLEEVTERVSKENYNVLQNAQRVYQAKQSIQLARRNLLPKLNLWRIIETPFSGRGLLGLVGDLAPFLVPGNWFRVKEEKLFAQAMILGYRALWANELLTARGLLIQASLEEKLLGSLEQHRADLERVHAIVQSRESLGSVPAGSARQVEIQVLAAREEEQTLKNVIQENRGQLAFLLGLPGDEEAVPSGIVYLAPSKTQPLRYEDHERAVLDGSPEIRQYSAMISAARHVKKERYFTFLGASPLSRGLGGGVFDGLPMQDGLGFGLGPSVRIVKSQTRILALQREAVEETLRRDLKILIESFNLDLTAREDAVRRLSLAQELFDSLEDRMRLGDAVDGVELVQAAETRMSALAAYHAIEVRLLLNGDRLKRMTFTDVYSKGKTK